MARMTSSEALSSALSPRPRTRTIQRPVLGREGMDLLARVPLFESLSHRHLRRLAESAEWASARPGAMVVMAGQPGKAFFAISEGTAVAVAGTSPTGRRLSRMGPGDFFGEMALLDGGPRTASVVAETPLTMIRLSRTAFRDLIRREPDVALKLLETVASRARAGLKVTE